jgi:hypothetical protein
MLVFFTNTLTNFISCQISTLLLCFVLFCLDLPMPKRLRAGRYKKARKKIKAKGCFSPLAFAPPPFCQARALIVSNKV